MVDPKIRTLLALVKNGSFTRTAEELSLTQPAVTHQIKLLEEEFGIKIFNKYRKELHVTQEGELLIHYARRALALSERVRQEIEDSKRSLKRLIIGITPTAEENLIPRILAAYCSSHPNVQVQVRVENIANVVSMLKAYELDLGIVEGSIRDASLTSLLLDTDHLCVAVSPKHELARKASVTLNQLKRVPLILRLPNTGTRSLFENQLYAHGESLSAFHVMMELDNLSVMKELVAANMGVAIISNSACRQEVMDGKLKLLPIENMTMTREINLIYPPDFQHPEIFEEIRRSFMR